MSFECSCLKSEYFAFWKETIITSHTLILNRFYNNQISFTQGGSARNSGR